ncbi:LacI family transcriptional regulator [Alphaproteobacteria bacterium]|nr:LacI family transcriptional regulator [Alphaproteobacteria bacterium]
MNSKKRINIKDFAKKIGLSVASVSRALNGHSNISTKTREKIIKAAKKYNYYPNLNAKRLASKRPDTIAFITTISPHGQDYVLLEFLAGLTQGVKNKSTELIFKFFTNEKDEFNYYQKLIDAEIVDKFVFYRTKRNDKRIEFLQKNKINFVTWGRSSLNTDYAWIDMDNDKSINILMERLVSFGHKKIALLNVHRSFNYGYQRKKAYENFHLKNNLEFHAHYYQDSLKDTTLTGIKLTKKLLNLKTPPTAIICSLDKYFIGCLQECQERGLSTPKDISVVGYNDHDNYLSSQNLTFISHPLTKMGKMAVEILEKIEKGENPSKLTKLIEPILNKGKSDGKIN